jgi:cytidylate kinase
MPVITISREFGSGATQVAQHICDVLGYSYFDKNLMALVAGEMAVSQDNVVDFSEDTYRMRGFFERLFGRRRIHLEVPETASAPASLAVETLSETAGIKLVQDTILAAYERDNVVIVGRGGQAVLRDKPGVLHVRMIAPLGARSMRVKERMGTTLAEATDLCRSKDQSALAYLSRFHQIDWDNPLLYHLVINTGKWEIGDVAQVIIGALTMLKTVQEL